MKLFDCDDIEEFNEYVGCKIDVDRKKWSLKFAQPVLMQSFDDEFELPTTRYDSPGEPGKILSKVEEGQELSPSI